MIRRISEQHTLHPSVYDFCTRLTKSGALGNYTGEVETSYSSRLSLATDNSIYQAIPQAVLFPKNAADIRTITLLANETPFTNLKFAPRGGGTGTNGQSLTEYIVIDMSRHMRDIIDINVEERWVRVQAGVIKDQLNDFLRPYGFFFAPDLSTSNRATIGGMINTDASGQGSLVYGKTSDHVLELDIITVDGTCLKTHKMPIAQAQDLAKTNALYAQVLKTSTEHRATILKTFPRLNRFLTGYDLEHVLSNDLSEFDLSRVITGSEGTLAFVTEAKLNITPIASHKTMINITYDSFDAALRNSPFLVDADATSVETIDSTVLNLAKKDVVWKEVEELIPAVEGKISDGLNIVEFNDEDAANQANKVNTLCTRLDALIANSEGSVIGYTVINDRSAMNRIYGMRKKSVGLLGNTKGNKKPLAFAEDTAVPPEHLADYIVEFRALLDSYGLQYGMFGHVDAGVLHVRPALDMMDPEQEKLLRVISDKVVALTAKYKGLMWGEHGKGYRSEYGPEFFGETLFKELRKIKATFDPNNRLNPGKICTPINSNETLVSVDGVKRASFDKQIPIQIRQDFEQTTNCNGNGLCYNYDVNSVMCPSYKESGDRRFSPKGRATLMREWLRLQGNNMSSEDITITKSSLLQWLWLPYKAAYTLAKKMGRYDFSHEVKESMDACLACKACTSACPVKVDVPTFRSQFIEAYYLRYMRPLSDHLVANVEKLMPTLSKASSLVNAVTHNPLSQFLITKTLGYVDAPRLSKHPKQIIDKKYFYNDKSPNSFESLNKAQQEKVVFIVQDAFVSSYESELLYDTVTVLDAFGYVPIILPFMANGKPQHVKGFLDKFEKTARKATNFYNAIGKYNRPMVGLDASMVLVYGDEYVKALGEAAIGFKVKLIGEWLMSEALNNDAFTSEIHKIDLNIPDKDFAVFNHCTEKSLLADASAHWPTIFAKLGIRSKPISTGCCGMAGTFGHERANQKASENLYNLSWEAAINAIPEDTALATGFSCRCQVKRFSKPNVAERQKIKHPIQLIAGILKDSKKESV